MAQGLRLIALALSLATGGATHAAEITERATSDGVVIAIRGDLEGGDDRKFDQVAQKYSKGAVYLESRGGDLVTGIAIGESIRLKGFITFLLPDTACASSCALAWLGGSRRFLSTTSRLGFHAAYRMDGTTARETGIGNAVVGAYLTRIGLPISAVIYITKASPDTITWLTPADAQKVGIEFSFIDNELPNKSANPLTLPQSQPPPEAQQSPSPSSQPTQKQGVTTPAEPPKQSVIRERFFVAVDNRVVELRNLPDRCAHIEQHYVSFIGKVVQTNFARNGVSIQSFVIEKLDGKRETINVSDIGALNDSSMVDIEWVTLGLQTMLRKGQEVSGEARLCREGQRVMFLEQLKRQGPAPASPTAQTSKLPKETQLANKPETLVPDSVNTKCQNTITDHYKSSCGKLIEVFKLSSDCGNALGTEDMEGEVAQTNFGDDDTKLTGFALEATDDGQREYINVEIPRDISISEIKSILQGLRSIIRRGQTVTGKMRRCGAAGRVLVLDSVKAE